MRLFQLWIVQNTRVVGREHRFGTGIAQLTISIGFPVFCFVVLRCFRNSYGTSPNLWVQKKFVKLRQSTQTAWLRPAELFGKFFSYPPFHLFRNLRDVLLSRFWIKCFLRLTVLCIFRCFPWTCRWFSLFLQRCHDCMGKVLSIAMTEIGF